MLLGILAGCGSVREKGKGSGLGSGWTMAVMEQGCLFDWAELEHWLCCLFFPRGGCLTSPSWSDTSPAACSFAPFCRAMPATTPFFFFIGLDISNSVSCALRYSRSSLAPAPEPGIVVYEAREQAYATAPLPQHHVECCR